MKARGEKSIVSPVPIDAFWATITDYLAYPAILEDIKSAEIVSRHGNVVVVSYQLRVLLKSFDYTLRMVEEAPRALTWSLVSSRTLTQNDGGWELEALSPRETRVTYWNHLATRLPLPRAFINALARLALPGMLKRWSGYAEQRAADRTGLT